MQIDDADNEHQENPEEDDDPWPEWNPQVFVPINQQNQVPQHLAVP